MLRVRTLGLQPYPAVFEDMKAFTTQRTIDTPDELWLLEHPPVYTQGQAGKPEHLLNPTHIPLIQSDRGGQITYHGPGQLVAYILFDLKRRHIGIRTLVCQLEDVLIQTLHSYQLEGVRHCGAPGVYVNNKKIASIGLRVKNGYTYHGIALNIAMDLKPFLGINPCGYLNLEMTQLQDYIKDISVADVQERFLNIFLQQFGP